MLIAITTRQVVIRTILTYFPNTHITVITSKSMVDDKECSVNWSVNSSGIQRSQHVCLRNNLPKGIVTLGNILT